MPERDRADEPNFIVPAGLTFADLEQAGRMLNDWGSFAFSDFLIENGNESDAEMAARVYEFLRDAVARNRGKQ